MNENGTKRREWVKTAAIVFLSVMLVLTFFSNTIMNYSLPEVSTQYVQSGSITAKIRGTGVVESGDPYEITINETRKVSGVPIRVGDVIQKGDVLLYLEDLEGEELKSAREALKAAQEAYDDAILNNKELTSEDINAAKGNASTNTYRKQLNQAQENLKQAKDAVKPLQELVAKLQQNIADCDAQLSYERDQDSLASERLNTANTAFDLATTNMANAEASLRAADIAVDAKNAEIAALDPAAEDYEAQVAAKNAELAALTATRDNAVNQYNSYLDAYNKAAAEKTAAEQNLNARNTSTVVTNVQKAKADNELQLHSASKQLTAAEKLVTDYQTQLDELVSKIGNVSVVEKLLENIKTAQERVDELTEKSIDATVTSDIAGTITQINIVAGNNATPGVPLVLLQPEGKGMTMSFSVTNDQAKRVSIGDRADLINAWRYDDVEVTLSSIKPDKTEPGTKKLLTFDVTGSVIAGQTLNISVGQKSASFDLIVPNSAIREDANGKFILTVESRTSPLNNRYFAVRTDVEVLASDERQSAISGALYGWEYVIINSTQPVEAGQQIRLAEN